ncbi:MAG: Na+/H+ antiporter NhaA, partial [Casimicrobiaceae bacterium]
MTLALANSPVRDAWSGLWEHSLAIGSFHHTLREWVNDALMAVFFLFVGLELKREVLAGELSSPRDAALPLVAAIGGIIVPVTFYIALNPSGPAMNGWGVAMATDIAFAVGILVMLGNRVPRGLLVFLTALAIADDLCAVLAIAVAYTNGIDGMALLAAAVVLAFLVLLNRTGIRSALPYALAGIVLWFFVLKSGVHATIAGILLAMTIPARSGFTPGQFEGRVRDLLAEFRGHVEQASSHTDTLSSHDMATIARALERDARSVQSPLHRAELALAPWVTYAILPLFAL